MADATARTYRRSRSWRRIAVGVLVVWGVLVGAGVCGVVGTAAPGKRLLAAGVFLLLTSPLLLLAIVAAFGTWRHRIVTRDGHATIVGSISRKEIVLSEVTDARWQKLGLEVWFPFVEFGLMILAAWVVGAGWRRPLGIGRLELKSPGGGATIAFDSYETADAENLVAYLRGNIPVEVQQGWEAFSRSYERCKASWGGAER